MSERLVRTDYGEIMFRPYPHDGPTDEEITEAMEKMFTAGMKLNGCVTEVFTPVTDEINGAKVVGVERKFMVPISGYFQIGKTQRFEEKPR